MNCFPRRSKARARGLDLGTIAAVVALIVGTVSGCASTYTTPGGPAPVDALGLAEGDIQQRLDTKPASPFPARLAMARVQASGYYSYGNESHGKGAFSVVTTRDIEEESDFDRIKSQPLIADVARLNKAILPADFESLKDLRLAAASLHTDLLFVYTLDTKFNIRGKDVGPLALITLGFIPNKKAEVASTASGAVYDVRTGYLYGLCEATARADKTATRWSSSQAVDTTRLKTERQAFKLLVDEFETAWKGITGVYAKSVDAAAVSK